MFVYNILFCSNTYIRAKKTVGTIFIWSFVCCLSYVLANIKAAHIWYKKQFPPCSTLPSQRQLVFLYRGLKNYIIVSNLCAHVQVNLEHNP